MGLQVAYRPPRVDGRLKMAAAKVAVETAGAEVLLEASKPLVPRDTDELRNSGHVEHEAGVGAAVIYDVTSDDGFPYGVVQHEDLALHHPNGGEAKFLERPLHTSGAAIVAAMVVVARART